MAILLSDSQLIIIHYSACDAIHIHIHKKSEIYLKRFIIETTTTIQTQRRAIHLLLPQPVDTKVLYAVPPLIWRQSLMKSLVKSNWVLHFSSVSGVKSKRWSTSGIFSSTARTFAASSKAWKWYNSSGRTAASAVPWINNVGGQLASIASWGKRRLCFSRIAFTKSLRFLLSSSRIVRNAPLKLGSCCPVTKSS